MNSPLVNIVETIREVVNVDPSLLAEDARLTDVVLDSMDFIEVLMILNSRFQVPLDLSEMEGVSTIGDLARYVAENGEPPR